VNRHILKDCHITWKLLNVKCEFGPCIIYIHKVTGLYMCHISISLILSNPVCILSISRSAKHFNVYSI